MVVVTFPVLPVCLVGVAELAAGVGHDVFLVRACVFQLHACSGVKSGLAVIIGDYFSGCFPGNRRYFSSQR